jgi:hypothetical protein
MDRIPCKILIDIYFAYVDFLIDLPENHISAHSNGSITFKNDMIQSICQFMTAPPGSNPGSYAPSPHNDLRPPQYGGIQGSAPKIQPSGYTNGSAPYPSGTYVTQNLHQERLRDAPDDEESVNCCLVFLSILIPLLGWIFACVMWESSPHTARACLKGSFVTIVIAIVVVIIIMVTG